MSTETIQSLECDICSRVEQHKSSHPDGWGRLLVYQPKSLKERDICPHCIKRLGE